jgi:hypothetical protein
MPKPVTGTMFAVNLDTSSGTPLFKQLFEQVRNGILAGRLRAGTRLPASRTFAADLCRGPAVVKSTVRRSRRFEISAVGHPPSRLLFYALLLLLFGYCVHRNPVAGVFGVLGFVIFIALYLIVRGPIAFRVGNADPPGLVLVNGREVRSREGHCIRRLERSGISRTTVINALDQLRGIWQLMPDTARRHGLTLNSETDDRLDVQKSTRAAARYLRDLHIQFRSWPLALAAYNAGEKLVQNAVLRAASEDFALLGRKRLLPAEKGLRTRRDGRVDLAQRRPFLRN